MYAVRLDTHTMIKTKVSGCEQFVHIISEVFSHDLLFHNILFTFDKKNPNSLSQLALKLRRKFKGDCTKYVDT